MGKSGYRKWDLPPTVVQLVVDMCKDYDRRNVVINFNTASKDVIESHKRTNGIIDAALETVEQGLRRDMLNDIILNRGYNFSPTSPIISKCTYYLRKRQIVYTIAKQMFLI